MNGCTRKTPAKESTEETPPKSRVKKDLWRSTRKNTSAKQRMEKTPNEREHVKNPRG